MDNKGQFLFSVQHFGQLEGCEPEAPVTSSHPRLSGTDRKLLRMDVGSSSINPHRDYHMTD